MNRNELYEKKAKLVKDSRAFLEECLKKGTKLSAEDNEKYKRME